jgi:outer membrane protein OmpA-like peptidoglycan-associated protein
MPMNTLLLSRLQAARPWFAALCCSAALWLAGCATPAPHPPTRGVPLPQAVDAVVDYLMSQTNTTSWLSGFEQREVLVEPVRDSATGQQTITTREAGRLIDARLHTAHSNVDVLPFRQSALAKARWVLSGRLVSGAPGASGAADKSHQTLQLSIAEFATGVVIAEGSVLVADNTLDNTPTPFFQDSPVLMNALPTIVEKSLPMPPPKQNMLASTLVDEAMAAYDAGRYPEAHALFSAAQARPDADLLAVNTGLYLVYTRLGQAAAARDAFGRMAAEGIARRSLAVKFLFEPGQVEFWADPAVSGPYAMWIGQIARQAAIAQSCMSVVGHSSRTGTETFNDQLSLARATRVGELLVKSAPENNLRLRVAGAGFHENLVGTGTDDMRDALDRRVEFKFSDCASNSQNVSTPTPG